MVDYEKLGSFYLGRPWNESSGTLPGPLLYDAKDLVTHAMVVGMTGSGKTGLSVGLLEEAAIDGIPSLVIDPKGDMGNLLLSFPALRPEDFSPWVDPEEAARQGKTLDEMAKSTATLWRDGLADWDQAPERIARFRDSVDMTIYTPGSSAGVPLSILRSFDAPAESVRADRDAMSERLQAATSGLLALLGIEGDPLQSREHILVSNLLQDAWQEGRNLDLAGLIQAIQKPPFEKLGVFDLETFYPARDRTALAMRLNGLLASPGFESWLEGDPLDVDKLLYTDQGKPRISIISIAHLSDSERMFVVSLLLNEVVSWMRSKSGTSSLRALLYMDEIFGFFPPSQNPPSKAPMLTLLKQARAFGLGVVLATQNPVDLDYKGLSNCGSWFIGRLQTERDKERLLDGLEGARGSGGATLDRKTIDELLGRLGKRVFLLNNVHEDGPVLFQTRWVLSYLRGPLLRDQIQRLMAPKKVAPPPLPSSAGAPPVTARDEPPTAEAASEPMGRPALPDGVEEVFVTASRAAGSARLVLRPSLMARAQLHFKRRGTPLDKWQEQTWLVSLTEEQKRLDWEGASVVEGEVPTEDAGLDDAHYAPLPAIAQRARSYKSAASKLKTEIYRTQSCQVYRYPDLKLSSEEDETESEFRQRVMVELSEARDRRVEKLRGEFADRLEAVDKKIAAAEERVERERSQLRDRRLQTAVSFGTSLLGAMLGRKKLSVRNTSRLSKTIRDASRSQREKDDVSRAELKVEDLVIEREELEQEFETAVRELQETLPPPGEVELEVIDVKPLKSDIEILSCALAWTPWKVDSSGIAEPLFEVDAKAAE